jgi:hypothetical protein
MKENPYAIHRHVSPQIIPAFAIEMDSVFLKSNLLKMIQAEPNVAWPHRLISIPGVNQRSSKSIPLREGTRKLFAQIIFHCNVLHQFSIEPFFNGITAAGLPEIIY